MLRPSALLTPLLGAALLVGASTAAEAASFVHPGVMHTQADLNRIKSNLNVEPWKSGYAKFAASSYSSSSYAVRGGPGCTSVVRDSAGSVCIYQFNDDANAAYQNALMWAITGNRAHASKSIAILNTWSSNLTSIGGRDSRLAAGLNGFKFIAAAELLRHTGAGWSSTDISRAESWTRNVLYPVVANFASDANGAYDLATMKSTMAFGIFLNDRTLFNAAVDRYYNGNWNGALRYYVINASGQAQESGRDQAHTQLGLSELAEMAEMGWAQGMDLYAAYDHRLLKGFEYTASYNLGNSVAFVPYTDRTGKYSASTISSLYRGDLRPIYEMVLNHYEVRRGKSAPFTKQAAQSLRPEGAAPSADSPGFGTLLFSRAEGRSSVGGTGTVPIGYGKCAGEGGSCRVNSGTGMVAYGANGSWTYKAVGVGKTVACTNAEFGWDPLPKNYKTCSFQL